MGVLLLIAAVSIALRTLINGQYGFHRDELLTYTNARHLDWGYVPYPPMTAFLARIELELFGPSLRGFRFFGAVAQSLMMLLAGLSARELGGKRRAQVTAAITSGLGGVTLVHGSFYSYTSFDQLFWILVAYFVVRLLKSEDPRWWLAIGASMGLGVMAKYSILFFAIGLMGKQLECSGDIFRAMMLAASKSYDQRCTCSGLQQEPRSGSSLFSRRPKISFCGCRS